MASQSRGVRSFILRLGRRASTPSSQQSGSQFVEARIFLKEFAELITGLSRVDCEVDFRPDLVGKKREHKEEVVPFKGFHIQSEAKGKQAAAKALKPFEVDGWKGHVEDLFNGHRGGQGRYRVRFVRHVESSAAITESGGTHER